MDPLGSLLDWIAVYGMFGLFALGLAERFLPALPSYGMLVAIGVAAADSMWSVPTAVTMTTAGSFGGGLTLYLLARSLGQARSTRLLRWIGRSSGLPQARLDRILSSLRSRERTLVFFSQLIPTVRLIAPLVSGLIGTDLRRFSIGTAVGISLWNGLFIVVGYSAILVLPEINASALAIKVLITLLATEAILALASRFIACRPRLSSPTEDQP